MLKRQINKVAKSRFSVKKKSSYNLEQLEQIFVLMEKHAVTELQWDRGSERLQIKVGVQAPVSHFRSSAPEVVQQPLVSEVVQSTESSKALSTNQRHVLSPFVGVFYRAPSPESDAYVKEQQTVKVGDVLCIVEAMKLMNEIESEVSGKILAVLVENGQPVEFGEPLFLLEV
jgi:acetyl-CoA carboxylase biotin carboxyl carrier protein